MDRRITDTNPAAIDPTRDVIATALEDTLIAELRVMQPHEPEHLPQTMRVPREIPEEIGLALVEWIYHLTSPTVSCRVPAVHVTQHTLPVGGQRGSTFSQAPDTKSCLP